MKDITLDDFIRKYESTPLIDNGNTCTYQVGKNPSGRMKCAMCTELSNMIDLEVSWTQKIDYGSMLNKEIELIEIPDISTKTAEQSRKTYLALDESQRLAEQYYLRKYITLFKCNSKLYALREKLSKDKLTIPLSIGLSQLAEIYTKNGFPKNFYHANPTVSSLYVKHVKHPLKHQVEDIEYESKDVIQIDYGFGSGLTSQKKSSGEVVLENDKYLYIRPDAEFEPFLNEYQKHPLLGFHFFANSLLSLYSEPEQRRYSNSLSGVIKGKNFREAFFEMRGKKLKKDVLKLVLEDVKRDIMSQ